MSPIVFAYVVTSTLLLAAGAAAIEHGTRGRGGARHFWTVAILLSVLAPCAALGWRAVSEPATTTSIGTAGSPAELATIVVNSGRHTVLRGGRFVDIDALMRMLPSQRALRSSLALLNRNFSTVAIVSWGTLSLALIAWIAIGLFHWRRAQRTWHRTTLDGVSVDVSAVIGPAVVGFLSHRIVLPAWATMMEPEHRRLVLAHESEHINARDPERLALAIAALVMMPWNIGLWWCAARLRRAIELDCDTRVLRRFPGTKEYGYVLLEVASRGRSSGALAVPMVALLRLPSELELRLRAMTRVHAAGTRGVIAGGIAAMVAIAAAFTTPVPSIAVHEGGNGVQASLPMTTTQGPPSRFSDDTGSKHRSDSVAVLKAENDSLRRLDRVLLAQLRSMPVNAAWLDSARTALAELRSRTSGHLSELGSGETPSGVAGVRPDSKNQTYFEFQVEKKAAQTPGSPTPVYPQSLLSARIGGEVDAQFVVDTAGRVDSSTIKITKTTNELFAAAVRSELPRMRFSPAEIGGQKVRQLVQQPFTFSISRDRE